MICTYYIYEQMNEDEMCLAAEADSPEDLVQKIINTVKRKDKEDWYDLTVTEDGVYYYINVIVEMPITNEIKYQPFARVTKYFQQLNLDLEQASTWLYDAAAYAPIIALDDA